MSKLWNCTYVMYDTVEEYEQFENGKRQLPTRTITVEADTDYEAWKSARSILDKKDYGTDIVSVAEVKRFEIMFTYTDAEEPEGRYVNIEAETIGQAIENCKAMFTPIEVLDVKEVKA